MSARETILTALADVLSTIPHVPVLRGDVLPERIPSAGLMILRDGTPGEPGVTLSPLTYHFQHRAELEMIVQSATDRDALFDALVAQVSMSRLDVDGIHVRHDPRRGQQDPRLEARS